MLCLNNVAGQGLDLENDTLPSRRFLSQISSYRNQILYFASVEWSGIVKILFLLQENMILGLLCLTAASI